MNKTSAKQAGTVGNTTAKRSTRPAKKGSRSRMRKEVWAILGPWMGSHGEYQMKFLPLIKRVLQTWQDRKLSLQEADHLFRKLDRQAFSPPAGMTAKEIEERQRCNEMYYRRELALCEKLHEFPVAIVAEALDEWCELLANGKRDLKKLAGMKKEVRGVFETLTDRERYLLASVGYHTSRSEATAFWDEIEEDFTQDPQVLEDLAADLEGDPRFGVLVRAYKLGDSAYRAYAQAL